MAETTTTRVRLPVKHPFIEDLLLWTNPIKSGIVFSGITTGYYMVHSSGSNDIMSYFFKALALAVTTMVLWHTGSRVAKRPAPPLPAVLKEGISEAQLRAYAERAAPMINRVLTLVRTVLTGSNPVLSGGVVAGLLAIAFLAARISLLTACYIVIVLLFTLPKLYEMRKDQIDAGLDAGRAKATEVYDKYVASSLKNVDKYIPKAQVAAESSSTQKEE